MSLTKPQGMSIQLKADLIRSYKVSPKSQKFNLERNLLSPLAAAAPPPGHHMHEMTLLEITTQVY